MVWSDGISAKGVLATPIDMQVDRDGGNARAMNGDNSPRRISAVIRALNEGKHIGRLLKGLDEQTVKPDEIIVVDSGSTDDTVAIAEAAGCKIVHIAKHEFSFGRALNRGCAAILATSCCSLRHTSIPFTTRTSSTSSVRSSAKAW